MDLDSYINLRYERWLDYARYKCSHNGLEGEERDLLNEVLIMLLEKPRAELDRMLGSIHGKYREIDWFVLKMIHINATSDTAPYRHRYRHIPVDANVDYRKIKLEDTDYEEPDGDDINVQRMNLVRDTFEQMDFSDLARRVFHWKLSGKSLEDWPGEERFSELNRIYRHTLEAVRDQINGNTLF